MFSAFLEWVVSYETANSMSTHYLHNFLFVGPHGSSQCQFLLDLFCYITGCFSVPLSAENAEGPSTILCFFGH